MDIQTSLKILSETVVREKPKFLRDSDSHLFETELSKELPVSEPTCVSKGFILPSGHLMQGRYLVSCQFNMKPGIKGLIKSYATAFLSLIKVRKVSVVSNAIFVTNSTSTNFFHWFLDVGQKLEHIDAVFAKNMHERFQIVIPARYANDFAKSLIAAFDLRVRWLEPDELVVAKNTLAIPEIAPTGNYRKEIVKALSTRLRKHFSKTKRNGCNRLYISRQGASKRKLINEAELIPILRKYGFATVDFDSLNFDAQISMVYCADMLVSLHGAGLTHMLWITGGSKIMEIRSRGDALNNCYFTLASDLGHEYHYILADKIDAKKTVQESDFKVNAQDFEKHLRQMVMPEQYGK